MKNTLKPVGHKFFLVIASIVLASAVCLSGCSSGGNVRTSMPEQSNTVSVEQQVEEFKNLEQSQQQTETSKNPKQSQQQTETSKKPEQSQPDSYLLKGRMTKKVVDCGLASGDDVYILGSNFDPIPLFDILANF